MRKSFTLWCQPLLEDGRLLKGGDFGLNFISLLRSARITDQEDKASGHIRARGFTLQSFFCSRGVLSWLTSNCAGGGNPAQPSDNGAQMQQLHFNARNNKRG